MKKHNPASYRRRKAEAQAAARSDAFELLRNEHPYHWVEVLDDGARWIDFWTKPEWLDDKFVWTHQAAFRAAMRQGAVAIRKCTEDVEDLEDLFVECVSDARDAIFG